MIQNKMKGLDPNQIMESSSPTLNLLLKNNEEEDLNKLDDYELDKRKADMDKEFEEKQSQTW